MGPDSAGRCTGGSGLRRLQQQGIEPGDVEQRLIARQVRELPVAPRQRVHDGFEAGFG